MAVTVETTERGATVSAGTIEELSDTLKKASEHLKDKSRRLAVGDDAPSSRYPAQRVVATSTSEAVLLAAVMDGLRKCGWLAIHHWTSRYSEKGYPDVAGVRLKADGTAEMIFVETKTEKGKVTPEQQAWLEALAKVPGVVYAGVLRPSSWMSGELDEVMLKGGTSK